MNKKIVIDRLIFNAISYFFISFIAAFCLFPFVMLVSASFSNESEIMRRGYGILPRGLSLESYGLVFKNPDAILRSYQVTIFVTAAGTLSALLFMSMAAYALSAKRFKWRNKISFFFFFTTLFNGGVVPWYILMVQYLRLKNNILALILPHLLNVFYLLILRSFFSTIPDAISESARIDGAGEFRIYAQLILPLAVPSLVTICLFVALYYWNDWYLSMMFISKQELYSLQYSLYRILSSVEGMKLAISKGANVNVSILPIETLKNSMAVVATGPILLLYPFLQRYFIKGLTIGAVKG